MLLPEKLAANCDHILVVDLSAIEKTHRLRLKRFLDCCSNVSSIAFRLRQKHEFSSSKPKVSPASSESRDDCGDAETFLGFLFFIPFPYNRLNPSVCKFLRGERSSKSESRGQTASVRDTERTLAIMLRRAERAISMFHNRAGAASLY